MKRDSLSHLHASGPCGSSDVVLILRSHCAFPSINTRTCTHAHTHIHTPKACNFVHERLLPHTVSMPGLLYYPLRKSWRIGSPYIIVRESIGHPFQCPQFWLQYQSEALLSVCQCSSIFLFPRSPQGHSRKHWKPGDAFEAGLPVLPHVLTLSSLGTGPQVWGLTNLE